MNVSNPSAYQMDFQKIRKKTQINDIHSLELYLINIFNDLSRRDSTEKQEKSIDKITFIEYMKIPYIVGEKLFHVFDSNRNGILNLTEFVSGIINLYSGGLDETQKIIFNLLDFDFDGKIIPEDSRLLIMFIKNLTNPPSGIIKKLIPRTTLTDDEDLEEINILIKNFFGDYSFMNFEEFKLQIENNNSDVFFLFICFLYNNKPFHDSSIRVLKYSCKNNNNLNVSSNSLVNSSFDNLFKTNINSKIRSPSKIFKSFIFDLVDLDVDEIEKDCEDNQISDNYKSDPEEMALLTNEECSIKSIPVFKAKINLEQNKVENDFIRTNTKNKESFGSKIIKKSYKNYLERKENYVSKTLKENKLFKHAHESIIMQEAMNYNNTFNNILKDGREKLSSIQPNGTFLRNNITNFDIKNNTFKKTIESSYGISAKIAAEDDSLDNNSKPNFAGDGTGGPPEKIDAASGKAKALHNVNKSQTDFSNPFMFKNKLSKKNATQNEGVFPKIEVLGHKDKLETNFTKNDIGKNRMSGMKLSIMSLENNNVNISNTTNKNNQNKILNSSSCFNRFISRDSARFSCSGELFASDIIFEGYIYRSDENNHLKKYYAVLVGNDLYYFTNSKKTTLKGIHNLSGTYIFKDPNTIKVREEYAKNSNNYNELQNNETNLKTNNTSNSNNNNNISSFKNNEGNISKENSNLNVINEQGVSKTVYYYPFKLYFKKKCRIYYCVGEEDVRNWVDNIRTVTKFREITDNYSIGEELGHGKFGKVKVGKPKRQESQNTNVIETNEEEKYAIKIINKINLKSLELELVKSEIEIMKFCRYRNIVKLIENFEDHENIYIILEYLSGGNLNNFLSSQKTLLTEDKIKLLVLQIASGINYLHHFGIIHRDLKPENIMMSDKKENAIVKIVDFGLSKVLGIFEKSNEAYGTLAYAAPEVIQKNAYNKTIDIWSLGVILYFLISGQFPFNDKNNNLHKIALEITSGEIKFIGKSWKRADEDAKELVLRCLERDVTKRIDIINFINHKWLTK